MKVLAQEFLMRVAARSKGGIEAVTRVKTGWRRDGEKETETFLFGSDSFTQYLPNNTEA